MVLIKATFVDKMGDDLRAVQAARLSFAATSETLQPRDEKLLKYLAEHEHLTPFEHCTLSAMIECPIYISKQVMRHRTFSYNEVSRRYTSKDLEIYCPPVLREQSTNNKQASEGPHPLSDHWLHRMQMHYADGLALYNGMVADNICREQARGVLPQDTMTSFIMTGNLRNWAHFTALRIDPHAQAEVRLIGHEIKDILEKYFPVSTRYLLTTS